MSTLSDVDIRKEIEVGRLIRNADLDGLAGACYELRMGDVYYDLSEGGKRIALSQGEAVLIKPGHRIVLITSEELVIPSDILVRVVSKGSLFSVGLSPVATYADPGFSGNLGIVTENISDKYVELPQGEPIAKADFTRLSSPAEKQYNGQHGFQMGIWPIKTHLQKAHDDVKHDRRVSTERTEALALMPAATRTIIQRIERTQAWINFGLILAIIVNSIALFAVDRGWMDGVYAIAMNLAASALIGLGVLVFTFLRRA